MDALGTTGKAVLEPSCRRTSCENPALTTELLSGVSLKRDLSWNSHSGYIFSFSLSTNVRGAHPIKTLRVAEESAVFLLCHFTSPKPASAQTGRSALVWFFLLSSPPSVGASSFLNMSPASLFRTVILPFATPHPSFSDRCVIWGPHHHHHHPVPPLLSLHLSHWVNFVQSVTEVGPVSVEEEALLK